MPIHTDGEPPSLAFPDFTGVVFLLADGDRARVDGDRGLIEGALARTERCRSRVDADRPRTDCARARSTASTTTTGSGSATITPGRSLPLSSIVFLRRWSSMQSWQQGDPLSSTHPPSLILFLQN
jgi:hypothetical protein